MIMPASSVASSIRGSISGYWWCIFVTTTDPVNKKEAIHYEWSIVL